MRFMVSCRLAVSPAIGKGFALHAWAYIFAVVLTFPASKPPPSAGPSGAPSAAPMAAPSAVSSKPFTFHSQENGYTIDLPAGWVEIPRDALDRTVTAMAPANARRRISYDSGFQLGGKPWMEYPYVLVQVIRYSDMGLGQHIREDQFAQVVQSVSHVDSSKLNDELSDKAKSVTRNLSIGQATLDQSRSRFGQRMSVEVAGFGQIDGWAAGYFGRDALVQVMFFSRAGEDEQYADVRDALIDSFHFDAATAYAASASSSNPFGGMNWNGGALKILVIVGVVVALVVGVVVILRGMSQSEEQRRNTPPPL